VDDIRPVADRVLVLLNNAGLDVEATAITVHNIVAVASLGRPIPMERVFESLLSRKERVEYEPEQFPAMIVKRDGASFLLFPTGKVVLTGVKDVARIAPAIGGLKALLAETL
jgi:transcription initiation factor TFIID TATA-box-binding protein